MRYRIEIIPSARKTLVKLPWDVQERLLAAFTLLQSVPIPPNARKLAAKEDMYRVRIGDYRAIYQVKDEELLVLIIKVGHRKDVYRGM